MKDKFQRFYDKYKGQLVEVNDPTNLYQCMDLAYAWCDFIQVSRDAIRRLYAYEVYTKPNDVTVKYFELVPNTPAGIPPVGSLVVFSKDIGGIAGHISIASGNGDTNTFESFDQNFGTDKTCRLVNHGYSAVLGWLVLRENLLNDDTKRAIEILTQYQLSNGLGNLEAAVRDLVGKADDAVACRAELIEYKNGEKTRIDSAVASAVLENDKKWQSQIESANLVIQNLNNKIQVLTLNQVENLDWRTLMSIAWKKFWSWKKAGGE